MVYLKILEIKEFMSALLIKNGFDSFYLSELEIQTGNRFTISGRLHPDWFTKEEKEALGGREYQFWKDVRPLAFQMIRGERTPLSMKLVFLLDRERISGLLEESGLSVSPEDVEGLFLNIRFEKEELALVTGTSLRIFTLDKALERFWDDWVRQFVKNLGIAVEVISTQLK